jgi:GPH family glycoside/pentoside/hexuronide:cation symporter
MGIVAGMVVLIYFLGDRSLQIGDRTIPMIIPILIGTGVGLSTNWLSPWSMIPDTVEYAEWKTGVRREGILYGIFYFVFKLGSALAGFLVGSSLGAFGYVANAEQGERALRGIMTVLTVVPFWFLIAGIVCISFFPITSAVHRKMVGEIESRGPGISDHR